MSLSTQPHLKGFFGKTIKAETGLEKCESGAGRLKIIKPECA
jgi:hypothetical protein